MFYPPWLCTETHGYSYKYTAFIAPRFSFKFLHVRYLRSIGFPLCSFRTFHAFPSGFVKVKATTEFLFSPRWPAIKFKYGSNGEIQIFPRPICQICKDSKRNFLFYINLQVVKVKGRQTSYVMALGSKAEWVHSVQLLYWFVELKWRWYIESSILGRPNYKSLFLSFFYSHTYTSYRFERKNSTAA